MYYRKNNYYFVPLSAWEQPQRKQGLVGELLPSMNDCWLQPLVLEEKKRQQQQTLKLARENQLCLSANWFFDSQ